MVLIIGIFIAASTGSRRDPASTEVAATSTATSTVQTAAPIVAYTAIRGEFSATGTLVFYPNNAGPVPYLMYVDQYGNTAAKALTFDNLPPVDFGAWTGSRISVTGILDREHVVVQRIEHVAPP